MILLILYVQTTYQTLLYQFNANSLVRDGWEDIYNNCNFNACGGFYYFGSPNNNKKISRIFLELEHHSRIIMDLQYLSVDSDVDPYVEIDSIIFNKVVTKTSSLICQNGQAEFIHNITITLPHNRRTFYVLMEFQFGGLISLKLNIIKCQDGCAGCIENYPQNCRQWKLHQYSFNNKMITYSDGWTFTLNYEIDDFCGNCQFLTFWEINYFTRLPPHQDVLIRFFKRHNTVVTVDYLYGKQTVSSGYQVEVLVKNHNDLILIVNIKSVSQNNFVRDFEVFYTQPDWLLPNAKINEGCLDQIDNKCLICKDGWNLDEIFGNCHAICGDGIIQLQEECDDGNQISNDSCHQCKYKCVEFCEICEFGTCLQLKDDPFYEGCQDQIDGRCLICQEGWISNEFIGNCHAICGDGIIQLHEECDDGNEISNDSCHQCKYKCVEFCEICEFGICLGCQGGFVINDKNNCDPQCGDGILIPYSLEQCELAVNGVFNDCLDCLITPIPKCKTNCFSVCLVCEDGYEFFNNSCLSVCGDEIVTKEEDCDDGNFEPYDGCFLCQYSCPENCYDCYQGTCLECNYQYQLLTSNECKQSPRCGDELLEGQEQCEDGNNLASDGCQNCLIEKDWICILNKRDIFSQCTFVKSPNFFINYLNMTYNKQYIIMQFNQKVKVETFQPLSETIYFELTNTEKKFWNGSLFIIQDVGSEGNQGEFIIIIEIYQLVESRPVLKVQVNQEVTIDRQNLCKNLIKFDENIYNAVLEDLEKQITLQYPQFIDEQQEGYSQGLKGLNQIIIYCLTGTVVINLLQGNTDLFIEIFAILQFQQYLRYLEYPKNLEIYFSFNDLITIQPLLDFLQFPQFFQQIGIQQNQEYSEGKFNLYKQNSNLIINLSCQLFQLLLVLFFTLITSWIKKVMYNQIFCPRFFYGMSQLQLYISPKIIYQFSQFFYSICRNLVGLRKFLSFQGLQQALLINGWDMTFTTLLYTRTIQTKNFIGILQLILASIILILYFTIFLDCFKGQQKILKIKNNKKFEILSFCRQFFFLLFVVYLQNSQTLQIGLLLLTSLFQIRLLFKYRSIFNKQNYFIQMVVEISVLTFILSSFIYIQEFYEFFKEDKKIMLGWIQANILSLGIIIELIVICSNLLLKLKKKFIQQPKITQNPLFLP